jgi:hypothetical protein
MCRHPSRGPERQRGRLALRNIVDGRIPSTGWVRRHEGVIRADGRPDEVPEEYLGHPVAEGVDREALRWLLRTGRRGNRP